MAGEQRPTISERLRDMSTAKKVILAIVCLILVAFVVAFFAYEKQIFEFLEPAVDFIRKSNIGMLMLAAIMAATCIFPIFGYSVVTMVCGYVYGIPKGFIPAFTGDIVGASLCFWIYRFAFRNYIFKKFKDNVEFMELSKAVSKDGLFVWSMLVHLYLILFLIRLSSLPTALLNAYFGAMTELAYWRFILATALSTPRLFLAIFIGHNISSLADPTITGKDRALRWIANIVGIIITLGLGWYIYRLTSKRIQRINAGLSAEEGEEENLTDSPNRPLHYDAVVNMEELESHHGPPLHDSTTRPVSDNRDSRTEIE